MMVIPLVLVALATGIVVLRQGLAWLLDVHLMRVEMWRHYWPFHLAFLVSALCVHLPVFWWMRERLNGTRPAVVFPVAGALLAVVPIAFLRAWGDARVADLTSAEALLLCASQAASGLFLGAFYPALVREAAERRGE